MSKTALVLGANGQDGSYLCDILVEKGYAVHAAVRRSSTDTHHRIKHLRDRVTLHRFDLADGGSIAALLHDVSPDEVYNCADQDHVGSSWETPAYSIDVTAGGALRVLEAVRDYEKRTRLYQPASATMFGDAPCPQTEDTPVNPQSPYAIAKYAAYQLARTYRKKYGIFVSCAILYNHDSPRRGPGYLLGDLVRGALDVKHGRTEMIQVRDLDAYVDIGFAGDYMDGVWRMMQLDEPGDYVLSSGEVWQVRDVVAEILNEIKILSSAGTCHIFGEVVIQTEPKNTPNIHLMGDYRKASKAFGFVPKTSLQTLLKSIIKEISKEYEP